MDKVTAMTILTNPHIYPAGMVLTAQEVLGMVETGPIPEQPEEVEPLSEYDQLALNKRFPKLKKLFDNYIETRAFSEIEQFTFAQYCELFHAIPKKYTDQWCKCGDCG